MIQSVFILTSAGEVIIEKHWREITPRSVCDNFWDQVNKYERRENVPPIIFTSKKYYLANVFRDNMFVVAVLTSEAPPLFIIEFLLRVVAVFRDYFGSFQESVIKDNFSTVYQLLEEMLDNGYPLTTEPNALKAMIAPPSTASRIAAIVSGKSQVSDVLPEGTVSNIPWRKGGVKYSQNEIYFDIVESIDAIVDDRGAIVSHEVTGIIHVNSRLSGTPDLTLVFTDPSVIDDCCFHPCVRLSRYERDRVVSFIPPDGRFELMEYRVPIPTLVPPIYCQPSISYKNYRSSSSCGSGDFGILELVVGQRPMPSLVCNNKKGTIVVEDIEVSLPFSKAVRTVEIEDAREGKSGKKKVNAIFDEALKTLKWNVGKIGKKVTDLAPVLRGKILLTTPSSSSNRTTASPDEKPAMSLKFKVPMSTVSGLAVETLLITGEKYKPYKGVRTLTQSGSFQLRT